MGLAKVQQVLARLYTDARLREYFFADPRVVSESLGLSSAEAQQLAQLSAQHVHRFASSLLQKRLNEVCKLLPLTHGVMGERFAALFRRYAETYLPQGTKKHREDAKAFATFVEQVAAAEGTEPPWVLELVRYEARWIKTAEPTCRWMACGFRYAVPRLVRALTRGNASPSPVVRPMLALWFRLPWQRRPCHVVLSFPRIPIFRLQGGRR